MVIHIKIMYQTGEIGAVRNLLNPILWVKIEIKYFVLMKT